MGNDIDIIYSDIISSVIRSGGIPIGISNNIDEYLNICDGFILQGGDDVDDNNVLLLKKINEKNKPVLGICLGMQEMGVYSEGNITNIDNHLGNKLHEIIINKNSLLYKIIGVEKMLVNSRHKSCISNTKLNVSGIANDGIIEAIEDNSKRFFLGVQWHPENMYDKDENARKIFDYFIKMCHH